MSELTFEVVQVPKTERGRSAAPNPYAPAVDALLKLDKGQALSFAPLAPEHTDKVIMRRMRALAKDVTLRSKFDKEANKITVWVTDKVKSPKTKTETETAAVEAPKTVETVSDAEHAKRAESGETRMNSATPKTRGKSA